MEILVINADCLRINSSANLCHLAYIRGLIQAGHKVSLLSAEGEGYRVDPAMNIPSEVIKYSFSGMSAYQKLSHLKSELKPKTNQSAAIKQEVGQSKIEGKGSLLGKLKKAILGAYGPYGIYYTFVKKAKKFRSEIEYDYVLSISAPSASHYLAYLLIKSNRIHCKHWIQIWEDPWYGDIYGWHRNDSVLKTEDFLLSVAEKVCYVSPLTLDNQKKLFPKHSSKMYWNPLPFYYEESNGNEKALDKNRYGYFGDYVPNVRNLRPFYEAASEAGIEVTICGNPSSLFAPSDLIKIYPRLTLDKLRPIEDSTNILIFLCNRTGGQIPGKIYQYSATHKKILFILDGTEDEKQVIRDFFGKFNRYTFCDNNKGDILRAINTIQSNECSDVKNVPVEVFEPTQIIERILSATAE